MTKIASREDFALSTANIDADVREGQREGIWKPCAAKLGWYWSHAHGGYINEGERGYMGREGWAGYRVETDVEDACFTSGVETLEQALAVLA